MTKHTVSDDIESKAKQRKPTAVTGLQIVEYLAKNPRGARLGEIAQAVQMDPGQTRRMIVAMQEDGWIVPTDADGNYLVAARVIRLGTIYTSRLDLAFHAQQYIENLFLTTRETVFLGELRNDEIICVDRRLSNQTLSVLTKVGESWPLVGTSIGSAIIAARHERLGDTNPALKATEDIETIIKKGYARDFGRYRAGVESVSATIRGADGVEVGAIAVTAPLGRVPDSEFNRFGELARAAAQEVSERLGWMGVFSEDGLEQKR